MTEPMHGSLVKPSRGQGRAEREERRAASRGRERLQKNAVRRRDYAACHGYCRWPGCKHRASLEVAHLEHKGIGGDRRTIRSVAEKMIQLCQWHHRGPYGLDTGDIEIRPLTPLGTNSVCAFYEVRIVEHVRTLVKVAEETSVGIIRWEKGITRHACSVE